jgi:hypothetical protein
MSFFKSSFIGCLAISSIVACGSAKEQSSLKMAPPSQYSSNSVEYQFNEIAGYPNLSPGMSHAFYNEQRFHVEINSAGTAGILWLPNGGEFKMSCNGDKNSATKCGVTLADGRYEFIAPIRHGLGVSPYGYAKLIHTSLNPNRGGDTPDYPVHRDPVYVERHLTSQETAVVVQVMRNFAIQTRAVGQSLSCSELAKQTEAQLIKNGFIYPQANESERVGFLLAANLIGAEGLCY